MRRLTFSHLYRALGRVSDCTNMTKSKLTIVKHCLFVTCECSSVYYSPISFSGCVFETEKMSHNLDEYSKIQILLIAQRLEYYKLHCSVCVCMFCASSQRSWVLVNKQNAHSVMKMMNESENTFSWFSFSSCVVRAYEALRWWMYGSFQQSTEQKSNLGEMFMWCVCVCCAFETNPSKYVCYINIIPPYVRRPIYRHYIQMCFMLLCWRKLGILGWIACASEFIRFLCFDMGDGAFPVRMVKRPCRLLGLEGLRAKGSEGAKS